MSHDNAVQESELTRSQTALTITEPPKSLNALSALSLARTTGCKVRCKDWGPEYWLQVAANGAHVVDQDGDYTDWQLFRDLLDEDFAPRAWEIVEEGATP